MADYSEHETVRYTEEEEGLLETLCELVDLASEMEERDDDKYAVFARVGGAVRTLLQGRQDAPSLARRESSVNLWSVKSAKSR